MRLKSVENSSGLNDVDMFVKMNGKAIASGPNEAVATRLMLPNVVFLDNLIHSSVNGRYEQEKLTVSNIFSATPIGTLIVTQSFAGERVISLSVSPNDDSHVLTASTLSRLGVIRASTSALERCWP